MNRIAIWTAIIYCSVFGTISDCKEQNQGRFEVRVSCRFEDGKKVHFMSLAYVSLKKSPKVTFKVDESSNRISPGRGIFGEQIDPGGAHCYWGSGKAIGKGQPGRIPVSTVGKFSVEKYVYDQKKRAEEDRAPTRPQGLYTMVGPGNRIVTLRLTDRQKYLDPPKVAPIIGSNREGYTVSWDSVPGASGYRVFASSSWSGGFTTWSNSNMDWKLVGVDSAIVRDIILRDTHCQIPGGIFRGAWRVTVIAISPDVRSLGAVPGIGWSQSERTVEVKN